MSSKLLFSTNRYLKNPKKAKAQIVRSVASSTAIETGQSINTIEAKLRRPRSAVKRVKLSGSEHRIL